MPSPPGPCPCPSCKGDIKTAPTIKRHAAEQARIAAEQANWRIQYEKALTRAQEDDESESESSGDDTDDIPVESRPPKRARIDGESNKMVSSFMHCLFIHAIYILFVARNR